MRDESSTCEACGDPLLECCGQCETLCRCAYANTEGSPTCDIVTKLNWRQQFKTFMTFLWSRTLGWKAKSPPSSQIPPIRLFNPEEIEHIRRSILEEKERDFGA